MRGYDAKGQLFETPGAGTTFGPFVLNTAYHANCYSFGILFAIQNFVAGRRGVSKQEAEAWASELRALGASGEYFFSINRYVFAGLKP